MGHFTAQNEHGKGGRRGRNKEKGVRGKKSCTHGNNEKLAPMCKVATNFYCHYTLATGKHIFHKRD